MKRAWAIAFVAAVTTAALLVSASARGVDGGLVPCGRPLGIRCARVPVALDRSGAIPGTIALYVERKPAAVAPSHGALFALAGGPGEAATAATERFARALAPALRSRDLVVFDQRGTGRSGFLDCPHAAAHALDEQCAAEIGPAVHHYTTRDSVEDLEAVRRRIGVDRIALFGFSYGTRVVQAYANVYPQHVELLILDSVVPVDGYDFFERSSYRAIAPALTSLCARNACRRLAPELVGDVARLADQARAGSLRATVVAESTGAVTTQKIAPSDLARILIYGFSLGAIERARLPAAARSARDGDGAPLGRLLAASAGPSGRGGRTDRFSRVLNRATLCEEITPPWPRTASIDERLYTARNALAAIPESAFYPLNRDAVAAGLISACLRWPISPAAPSTGGTPPNVPVLVLQGALDTLTPPGDAEAAAARFPQARIVTVPDAGHAVALSAQSERCVQAALSRFLAHRRIDPCRSGRPAVATSPIAPTDLDQLRPWPRVAGRAGKTLRAVIETIRDVNLTRRSRGPRTGLRGGRFTVPGGSLVRLKAVVYVPDVAVSGKYSPPLRTGVLSVAGAGGGKIVFDRGGRIVGTLAGVPLPKGAHL